MKRFLLSLIGAMLFWAMPVMGEGIHLGYCDGVIADDGTGLVTGLSGTDATIQAALFVTPEMLKGYESCQITSIGVGLAENAAAYPETVTAWVRTDREGENVASGTCVGKGGWTAVALDKTLDVKTYADSGLWIGFTYVQPKKLSVLAFLASASTENTGWTCKNGKWNNYSAKGALPIELIVEGEGLPQHDMALTSVKLQPEIVQIGGNVKVKATIKNKALVAAVNPVINYDILDGKIKGSYNVPATISYRQTTTVEFSIPSTGVTEETEGKMKLDVAWSDGSQDEVAEDNARQVSVTFAKSVFYKRMLVEEATGAWCGFCVRGIVGLREMTKNYPDQFIGLAVHNGDAYVVKSYDTWIGGYVEGYPSCLVNRGFVADPEFAELEAAMQQMDIVAKMDVEPWAEVKDGKIAFTVDLKTAKTEEVNYNVVYVFVENKLPLNQTNYYAGGGYGPMGGFESLGGHCTVDVDDVVRQVYPSPLGERLPLDKTEKDGSYRFTYSGDVPEYVDLANCHVVAFVVDANTGEVVNAGKGIVTTDATGVERVKADGRDSEVIGYNMAGQRVGSGYKGIVVNHGKKQVVR